MSVKMRRNFSGAFSAHTPGDGTWRITRSDPAWMQVIVIGANPKSVQACGRGLHGLGIEWQGQRALITTICAGQPTRVEARCAIVHEALPSLHAALPLADFDARAQRFWRRVFVLVRIPGGRRLLGILARASQHGER